MSINCVVRLQTWDYVLRRVFVSLLVVCVLSACAGLDAFHQGQGLLMQGKTQQGLAKLEEAVRLDPKNAEYRIALATGRASAINQLLAYAETARRQGRLSDAEKAYRDVQALDAEHAMARQGMEAVDQARKHQRVLEEVDALVKKGAPLDLDEARAKLRIVLSEQPGHKAALYWKARIEEQRAKEIRPETKLAATFRKPISLEFRDAPLKSVLEVVSKISGLNFYFDRDIRPDLKATVVAKNTSIEDALRMILITNQLEQKTLNERSILIYPSTPQKMKDYQTLAVRSFYLANADVKAVANSIKTLVKTKDVVIDERLGILIVRDTPEAIRMAERIVSLQDLSDPEVMLEVEVMEVKRSRLQELGIKWPSQLTLAPLEAEGAPLTLEGLKNITDAKTQASIGNFMINARKEDQDGNILANPRIRVRNKEKAKIQIGDRVPVITTTSTSTGFVSESVNYIDVGLKLEVEPAIYLDEEVGIKINLEVSNLVREVLSKTGTLSYQIGTRGANTVLRLKDGETQILAGLISDEDRSSANKVPGLGELPLLGRLFRSQKDDTQRSEILLSITPRIVRSIQRPELIDAEFESGTESSIGASALRLSTAEPSAGEDQAASAAAPTPPIQPGKPASEDSSPKANPPAQGKPSDSAASLAQAGGAPLVVQWQAPAQVRVGEQFSAVLRINSTQALKGAPILLGFDPQVLQVLAIEEGDFFKQGNAQTSFTHRIDPAQGKVFAALVRQNPSAQEAGINGLGTLITVRFTAIKSASATRVQLLSVSPEPMPSAPLALPIEHMLRVEP